MCLSLRSGYATGAPSCGIIAAVDASDLPGSVESEPGHVLVPGRLVGLRGRLARPFWGWIGSWAVLCGVLASNRVRWDGEGLLALALVLILVELAWGSLWDLAVETDWFQPLAEGWSRARPASLPSLPYTQPGSPGGRLWGWISRVVGWWREAFWPVGGPALLGMVAAAILTAVLTVLLPEPLRLLNAAVVALVGLGVARQRRGKRPLLGQAAVQVGLSWLAGHAALAEVEAPSLVLALSYTLAAWGALRLSEGRLRGLWLLNGGQVAGVVLLVVVRQPLAAGFVGLLLFGQVVVQPLLRAGGEADRVALGRRMWPWLLAAMLAAALALP